MTFIDTHTHIYLPEFDNDRDEIMQRAVASGTNTLLLPNVDSKSISQLLSVEKAYPNCKAMMGLHPTSVKDNYKEELDNIQQHLFARKYIAVGEIGIDLYWDKTHIKEQLDTFKQQLQWAIELDIPVAIHCRDAFPEVLNMVDQMHNGSLRGVFHSFSGGLNEIEHIRNYKTFKLGINGTVTFKKSHLPDVLKNIDLSYIVMETDAPYLAPQPNRGKRNEPSYVPLIAAKLAEIYSVSIDEIAKATTHNAQQLFKL